MIRTYQVAWRHGDFPTAHSRVAIGDTSNHRTTLGDIPQILSISNGVPVSEIVIESLQLVVGTEP